MTSLAVVNIGALLTGELAAPLRTDVTALVCEDGVLTALGTREELADRLVSCDVTLDAAGTTVAAGLIDSHCHVVLGDYTPRQKTVDFLDSYVHGGITSVVSPGEIHAPGRPHSAVGVKALAITAHTCFTNFRPTGMRVNAGSVVLEPTLSDDDFAELAAAGVRYAKFGFGDYADPADGEPQVRGAQRHGITVMCHTGGASIPGSKPITPEHLLTLRPDVAGHINGGPTAPDADGVDRVIAESEMALQLVQAGNLRNTIRIARVARDAGQLARVVIGSDTPTGTGVMPLGVIKTVAEIASLAEIDAAIVWALASGNNADVFGLPTGRLAVGRPADFVVMDAPWGARASTAAAALADGDIPGISAVVIDGQVRTLRSRNTPAATRSAAVDPPMPHLSLGH